MGSITVSWGNNPPFVAPALAPTKGVTGKSYLECCREDLSPNKVSALDGRCGQSTRWKVAAVATPLFYLIACGFFGAMLPFCFPTVFPILLAGVGGALAAIPGALIGQRMHAWITYAKNCTKTANAYREIQKSYAELQQTDPNNRLNPIRAQAIRIDKKVKDFFDAKTQCLTTAATMQRPDGTVINRALLIGLHVLALQAEEREVQYKIEAAFIRAVLQRGDFNGKLDDIASCSRSDFIDRSFARSAGSPIGNAFLTFKNRSDLPPITYDDAKNLTVGQLGDRIFAAMPALVPTTQTT